MSELVVVVWHYWIGVLLAVGAIAALVALVVLYLTKVTSTRYPK